MFIAVTLVVTLMGFVPPVDDNEAAIKLAIKVTNEGVELFDRKDAKALAETYTEDATLTVISKVKDTNRPRSETKRGRGNIQADYLAIFKDSGPIHSKNTVEYARLTQPNVLLVAGFFEPGLGDAELKVGFAQVRFLQDGKWLISSMQIFMVDEK